MARKWNPQTSAPLHPTEGPLWSHAESGEACDSAFLSLMCLQLSYVKGKGSWLEWGEKTKKGISRREVRSVSLPWGPEIPKYSLRWEKAFGIPYQGEAITENLGGAREGGLRAEWKTSNHLAS